MQEIYNIKKNIEFIVQETGCFPRSIINKMNFFVANYPNGVEKNA